MLELPFSELAVKRISMQSTYQHAVILATVCIVLATHPSYGAVKSCRNVHSGNGLVIISCHLDSRFNQETLYKTNLRKGSQDDLVDCRLNTTKDDPCTFPRITLLVRLQESELLVIFNDVNQTDNGNYTLSLDNWKDNPIIYTFALNEKQGPQPIETSTNRAPLTSDGAVKSCRNVHSGNGLVIISCHLDSRFNQETLYKTNLRKGSQDDLVDCRLNTTKDDPCTFPRITLLVRLQESELLVIFNDVNQTDNGNYTLSLDNWKDNPIIYTFALNEKQGPQPIETSTNRAPLTSDETGRCNASDWKDIVSPVAVFLLLAVLVSVLLLYYNKSKIPKWYRSQRHCICRLFTRRNKHIPNGTYGMNDCQRGGVTDESTGEAEYVV
ncbi:uncharacterized protein LOC143275940 isoform X2 [Babylonia areolata]|uniref:uncharacterized protein LOC143275940 isoform X2 n=1 Tax=Babylonia areolata TaxID=304850 RepID=UPI003FD3E8DD